ncbi:MAG: ATP-binding protein [Gammaproteobacteria bacterium]
MADKTQFKFKFLLSTLNHLGRGLYRSFATVIAEAISNAWDADAERVDVKIKDSVLTVTDNGTGMSQEDMENKFLNIGYSRRKTSEVSDNKKRRVLGRKGIGKLAYLSISKEITVITKQKGKNAFAIRISNDDLDVAINEGREEREFVFDAIVPVPQNEITSESGTQLIFKGLNKGLVRRNIRQILATQFHFVQAMDSGDKFEIYVNGEKIGAKDLKDLYQKTQYIWFFNERSREEFDEETKEIDLENYERHVIFSNSFSWNNQSRNVRGYIASVKEPGDLRITGSKKEFKANVALFAGGRVRESELIAKITLSQIPESYLWGRIHLDDMDAGDVDRFTSGRDSVKEDDPLYVEFLGFVRKNLEQIMNDWKKWRKESGDSGDPEDKSGDPVRTKLDEGYMKWVKSNFDIPRAQRQKHPLTQQIRAVAQDNLHSYLECFASENLMRFYISHKKINSPRLANSIACYKVREKKAKIQGNISSPIRIPLLDSYNNDLNYLGARDMAQAIDIKTGQKDAPNSLGADMKKYKLIRDAIMHTAGLTDKAHIVGSDSWVNIINKILNFMKK